ncbi:MAG: propionyl-CoA synthetase, partial [Alphaproteobacteria bacterium]|nr:propionyl-CoA synthetase [Alphaproteobacteria bacterium]
MTDPFSAIKSAAQENPQAFWAEAAKDVAWMTPYTRVLNDDNPPFYRWFEGGTLNTCYNALDRHIAEGRGDQAALIY